MKAVLLLVISVIGAISMHAQKGYPVPPESPDRLFYIQHNRNHNTFVYDANVGANKTLNAKEPIDIYRIAYTKGGKKEELSGMQRKLAYGVTCSRLSNGTFEFCLVSFPDKKLYLKHGSDGRYVVTTTINGREMILHRIFLATKNDSLLSPKLDYADFYGKCPKTGREIKERFYIKA
ncbi:hypothetical protein CHU92_03455 [Flavobacterium cyanobacteriorum]|uniref:DUF4833 domain-containing protein n=1 Tax=Flavobacterium cyanobacteriorum TaxID=2022802 RepID=A0A255ZPM2_9FLAO|nr:DUF4833 domain-containing protein [Flavobacterium cyanobacteriorum]OYQ43406.1 hypothetical protein CHU92_03455 [Flavobacterium cyanobacteriorum]